MNTTLCPGKGCAKADTCLRAIRYALEPNAPSRAETLLFDETAANRIGGQFRPAGGYECQYYYADTGKRATREPNAANLIGTFIDARLPELANYHAAWVTGSTVWRVAYAMPPSADADLDVFVCHQGEYVHVCNLLKTMRTDAPFEKPKRRGSMEGERIHTRIGWVDCWLPRPLEQEIDFINNGHVFYDPFYALRCYPPTTHAHCRVAYNPANRALITIANEFANDEGAMEMHERAAQWHVEQADRLIKLARRSA